MHLGVIVGRLRIASDRPSHAAIGNHCDEHAPRSREHLRRIDPDLTRPSHELHLAFFGGVKMCMENIVRKSKPRVLEVHSADAEQAKPSRLLAQPL